MRSSDELGEQLFGVTFVVLDLETTGGSPDTCAITEVGAVKLRGGASLGKLHTLVNPGLPIPPAVTYLTGVTEAMVLPAPPIDAVLPSLLEFLAGAVIVGHNVRFDLSFIQAALRRAGYARLTNLAVDTCALARRLVRDEVPDCRLATLAGHFRTERRPTHRALDDAEATGEVLHCLLERAGRLGVLALEDLVDLPTLKGHPQLAKLKLTNSLPRLPGVYAFRDACGLAIYVGKAVNLRRRVRSYFAADGDDRRRVGSLLRELAAVDHVECSGLLEASVLQIRLVHQLSPSYNRKSRRHPFYLKVTVDGRISVVRKPKPGDHCVYLGPLASTKGARLVADAIAAAVVLPDIVNLVLRWPRTDPALLLGPLQRKLTSLAGAGRFEEAAGLRQGADALADVLRRQRRLDALRSAGRITIEVPGEGGAIVDHGQLVASWCEASAPRPTGWGVSMLAMAEPVSVHEVDGPLPCHVAEEVACVAAWLDARADRLRLVEGGAGLAWPLGA